MDDKTDKHAEIRNKSPSRKSENVGKSVKSSSSNIIDIKTSGNSFNVSKSAIFFSIIIGISFV